MSQNRWEGRVSALALEASTGLRRLAGPAMSGDRVKSQIARAARAAGLSYWRAFDLWYRKARRIEAQELEAIRAAAARRSQEKNNEFAAIADDFEALAERVSRLAAGSDRASADRMRALAVRVRRLAPGE
jgi:hypothetical protein